MARIEENRLPEDAGREIPVEMEKTYRLLALVRGQTFARPKYVEGDEVMVWAVIIIDEPPRVNAQQQHVLSLGFWPGFGVQYTLIKLGFPQFVYGFVVPIIVMLGLSALLVWIIRRVWLADTREVMIALFT